jgi:hypothetical protein
MAAAWRPALRMPAVPLSGSHRCLFVRNRIFEPAPPLTVQPECEGRIGAPPKNSGCRTTHQEHHPVAGCGGCPRSPVGLTIGCVARWNPEATPTQAGLSSRIGGLPKPGVGDTPIRAACTSEIPLRVGGVSFFLEATGQGERVRTVVNRSQG